MPWNLPMTLQENEKKKKIQTINKQESLSKDFYSEEGWLVGYGAAFSNSSTYKCCKITDYINDKVWK